MADDFFNEGKEEIEEVKVDEPVTEEEARREAESKGSDVAPEKKGAKGRKGRLDFGSSVANKNPNKKWLEPEPGPDSAPKKDPKVKRYHSKYRGLKLIMRPTTFRWDEKFQRKIKNTTQAIRFVDHEFSTSDPEEISFLDEYIKRNSSEVFSIDEKIQEEQEALALAKEILKNRKRSVAGGRQGAVG